MEPASGSASRWDRTAGARLPGSPGSLASPLDFAPHQRTPSSGAGGGASRSLAGTLAGSTALGLSSGGGGGLHSPSAASSSGRGGVAGLLSRTGASVSPGPGGRREAPDLEHRVLDVEQRVEEEMKAEGSRIRACHEQFLQLEQDLKEIRSAREMQRDRRTHMLKLLEDKVRRELTTSKQEKQAFQKNVEERARRELEEQGEEVRAFHGRASREEEEYRARTTQEINKLSSLMAQHSSAREEYGQRVLQSFDSEFKSLDQRIDEEHSIREGTKAEMTKMVQDVKHKMQDEIERERVERETVQGRLLELLEETCQRIEGSFSAKSMTMRPVLESVLYRQEPISRP